MKLLVIIASSALVVSSVAGAIAHNGATGVVKERMVAMGAMGKAMKSLAGMMRGDSTYDAETVRNSAAVLQSHSGEALTALFPKDSISGPSEALPAIWSNWQEFEDLSEKLGLYATALGRATDKGLQQPASGSGMSAQMMMGNGGMMGQGMMGQGMMGTQSMEPDPDMLAEMPVQALFNMTAQTCSVCHTKFRVEK
ncbi:hypothetical protein GCM10007094_41640 [Pseudovibrio japonicus]|uniref:Cytochrome c556 n=1 Tax=Pseudovibrio japonicus TaxID=366534 RepID=A0ABQ3EN64_9HYPH|nr:cytochrome c [Pseudovibrio japonicus]GHB47987.1 hypothetical protein GCM10007094_41640 [Pseudovibrio japonicus]